MANAVTHQAAVSGTRRDATKTVNAATPAALMPNHGSPLRHLEGPAAPVSRMPGMYRTAFLRAPGTP